MHVQNEQVRIEATPLRVGIGLRNRRIWAYHSAFYFFRNVLVKSSIVDPDGHAIVTMASLGHRLDSLYADIATTLDLEDIDYFASMGGGGDR